MIPDHLQQGFYLTPHEKREKTLYNKYSMSCMYQYVKLCDVSGNPPNLGQQISKIR